MVICTSEAPAANMETKGEIFAFKARPGIATIFLPFFQYLTSKLRSLETLWKSLFTETILLAFFYFL